MVKLLKGVLGILGDSVGWLDGCLVDCFILEFCSWICSVSAAVVVGIIVCLPIELLPIAAVFCSNLKQYPG